MENTYQRRYQELKRCLNRIEKIYNWEVIKWEGEDSLQSPKDLVLNFFRVWYELKELLKLVDWFWWYNWVVEWFCKQTPVLLLALDIANSYKHGVLHPGRKRSSYSIWEINTWIHVFDPTWKPDRTELTIEIDWIKKDCFPLCKLVFKHWKDFLKENDIL